MTVMHHGIKADSETASVNLDIRHSCTDLMGLLTQTWTLCHLGPASRGQQAGLPKPNGPMNSCWGLGTTFKDTRAVFVERVECSSLNLPTHFSQSVSFENQTSNHTQNLLSNLQITPPHTAGEGHLGRQNRAQIPGFFFFF